MAGIALKPLTVDFHEPGFNAKLASENQFGPWFMLSDKERQQLGDPMGPVNPQALNRYSYTLNNPVRYVDPSGHSAVCTKDFSACNGARVVNNSSHSILVKGDMLLPDGTVLDDQIFRLEAGQSSISIGIFDIDEIFVDSTPIDGHNFGEGTRLAPGSTTVVQNDSNGELTIGRKVSQTGGIPVWYDYQWGTPEKLATQIHSRRGVDMSSTRHVTGAEAYWAYVDAKLNLGTYHNCAVPGACTR